MLLRFHLWLAFAHRRCQVPFFKIVRFQFFVSKIRFYQLKKKYRQEERLPNDTFDKNDKEVIVIQPYQLTELMLYLLTVLFFLE